MELPGSLFYAPAVINFAINPIFQIEKTVPLMARR